MNRGAAGSPWRAVCLALLLLGAPRAVPAAPETLRFSVAEGRALNEFYREGPIAAHLVLTSGATPRLVVAFPAGNSGAAVWFEATTNAFAWQSPILIQAAQRTQAGGTLYGISAELTATGGALRIKQALTSNVRVIRDYEYTGKVPDEVVSAPRVSAASIVWERRRLDGAPGYSLALEMLAGSVAEQASGAIELRPQNDRLLLRVTALTGDRPLTPIAESALFTAAAAPDARLRHTLAFLSYQEKLLAGSWRFNTYFGRDTLMSLRLLSPALQPSVMEAGLGAVLERLNAGGEVAHEEDIGEFAILRHMRAGSPPTAEPLFDYKMIDDDFELAVVAAHYLLDSPGGPPRAATFLARKTSAGEAYGAALVRNFRFVLAAAGPFAQAPALERLVSLKMGEAAGNWRDSDDGLGGGRLPYDVNGVLVPAALDAIARLHASGVLEPYLNEDGNRTLARSAAMAGVWLREAPRLFDVTVPVDTARARIEEYGRQVGVDPKPALTALGMRPVQFRAVALDASGKPVPVLNSDEGLSLLLLTPPAAEVDRVVGTVTRPFPAGLLTDVGLLVANPAYASEELRARFDRHHYHGTVIWSWQQAVLASGIQRQLRRTDLTGAVRQALEDARSRLRVAINATQALRGSELWSWSEVNGGYRIEPFGQRAADATESNAAQLWSTVQLARPLD